jgi:hypothetical protein
VKGTLPMRFPPFIRPALQPQKPALSSPVRFGKEFSTDTPLTREDVNFLSRMFNGETGFDLIQQVANPVKPSLLFLKLFGNEASNDRFIALLDEFQSQGFFANSPETIQLTPRGEHVLSKMNEQQSRFAPLNAQLKTTNHELAQREIKPAQAQVVRDSKEHEIDEAFQQTVGEIARQRIEFLKEHLRESSWNMSDEEIAAFRQGIRGYAQQIADSTRQLAKQTNISAQTLRGSQRALKLAREKAAQTLTRLGDEIFETLKN